MVDGTSLAAAEEDLVDAKVKPFEDIPVPGGHDSGLMGILAPLYHAVKGNAFNKPHIYQQNCAKEFGPIFRQNGVLGWIVALSDPHDFETVFRRAGKYPMRPVVKSWIDYRREHNHCMGLVTSEGEDWNTYRNAVSKGILKPSALASHVTSMHEVALEFVQKVKSTRRPDGVMPDIENELYKWSLESAATFFFDRRLNLITEKTLKKENQAFFDSLQVLTWNTSKLLMIPEEVLKFIPRSMNPMLLSNKAWGAIFSLVNKYINDTVKDLAAKAARGENIANSGTFLAFLVAQDKLTYEEIIGNLAEIVPAAVDTTAHTTTWLLHLISKNPRVQEKLYDEVQQIIPDGTVPTQEKLDDMKYLKATVKEAQRLYPITIGTARVLEEDIELRGYHIPAGTHCQTTYYNAGRDPNVFDDPEEFLPERWLDKNKKYHPFASLPFGYGTRMCVGRRLAQQEMYLLLAEVTRHFLLSPTKPNVGSNCGITIHPEESVEPKMVDRK